MEYLGLFHEPTGDRLTSWPWKDPFQQPGYLYHVPSFTLLTLEWQANLDPEDRLDIVVAFNWILNFLMQKEQSSFGVSEWFRPEAGLGLNKESRPQRESNLGNSWWDKMWWQLFLPLSQKALLNPPILDTCSSVPGHKACSTGLNNHFIPSSQ